MKRFVRHNRWCHLCNTLETYENATLRFGSKFPYPICNSIGFFNHINKGGI